jgi:hypothetical protein
MTVGLGESQEHCPEFTHPPFSQRVVCHNPRIKIRNRIQSVRINVPVIYARALEIKNKVANLPMQRLLPIHETTDLLIYGLLNDAVRKT